MYAAPTYGQARDIFWDEMIDFIPPALLAGDPNISRMEIKLINGSKIRVRGTHKPDSLRGQGLDFLVMDEFTTMEQSAWQNVLRPMLSDRMGGALFISSPAGFGWAHDLFTMHMKNQQWSSHQYTTLQGGQVSIEEIRDAAATLPTKVFEQEYLASFMSLQGRVYYGYDQTVHLDTTAVMNKKLPILLGVDFNVNPMTAVACQIRHRVIKGEKVRELVVFDEFRMPDSNTMELITEVKNRYGKQNVIAYPDASGKSRHTSSHQSDHKLFQSAGIAIATAPSNPYVSDRINQVNALFTNQKGDHRLWINPKCEYLSTCLLGHTYKPNTSIPDKGQNIDHILDALGYAVNGTFPIGANRVTIQSASL